MGCCVGSRPLNLQIDILHCLASSLAGNECQSAAREGFDQAPWLSALKSCESLWLGSEKLKKAVAVSEEKIVPEGGADFPAAIFLPENAQTLAGIAFRAAGKSVNNFPAASKFARKLFQQGISDSHSPLEFSCFRKVWVSIKFLSAKFGLTRVYPPPRKGPKMRKNCTYQ